jgi:hypothetical protein
MTADEVAALLGVDRQTVYDYAGRPARPALAQAREHTEATAAAMIWPVWQHPKDEQLAMIERWKESIR